MSREDWMKNETVSMYIACISIGSYHIHGLLPPLLPAFLQLLSSLSFPLAIVSFQIISRSPLSYLYLFSQLLLFSSLFYLFLFYLPFSLFLSLLFSVLSHFLNILVSEPYLQPFPFHSLISFCPGTLLSLSICFL